VYCPIYLLLSFNGPEDAVQATLPNPKGYFSKWSAQAGTYYSYLQTGPLLLAAASYNYCISDSSCTLSENYLDNHDTDVI